MRLKPQRAAIDLLVGAIFLALTVSCLAFKNMKPTELLVAWGWQGEPPKRKCILQVIKPKNQAISPAYFKSLIDHFFTAVTKTSDLSKHIFWVGYGRSPHHPIPLSGWTAVKTDYSAPAISAPH